jgi:AcrR family transcriptional regulator
MPRQPDPDLEDRILKSAHALWKRGGEEALTMRAVARAARTNTPAVYRRFKNRRDLVRGVLRSVAGRIREHFVVGKDIEAMADAYVDYALKLPHDYELFYAHSYAMSPPKGKGRPRPIRESRPNFDLLEQLLAQRLGGAPADHTQRALAIWGLLHGTCMLLVSESIPEGHEEELREACRVAVRALLTDRFGSK